MWSFLMRWSEQTGEKRWERDVFWEAEPEGEMSHPTLPNALGSTGPHTACRHTHLFNLSHTLPSLHAATFVQRTGARTRPHKSCTPPVNCTKVQLRCVLWVVTLSVTTSDLMMHLITMKLNILHLLIKSLWLAKMNLTHCQYSFLATLNHENPPTECNPWGKCLSVCYVTDTHTEGKHIHASIIFLHKFTEESSTTSHAALVFLTRKSSRNGDKCTKRCQTSGTVTNAATHLNPGCSHHSELFSDPSHGAACCHRHTQRRQQTGQRQHSDPQQLPFMAPDFEPVMVQVKKI